MDEDPRLYTLNEAADVTGLSVDALRQRIRRGKIRAFHSNDDGMVRLRLTKVEIATLAKHPHSRLDRRLPSLLPQEESSLKVLEAAITALREQSERAEQRAAAERTERERERERATRAEQRAERAEARAEKLEAERDSARAELAEWTEGGPFARAWRAFSSRRGRSSGL
jgi:septal ring factor EnvC (AmiA/AmiB activator)